MESYTDPCKVCGKAKGSSYILEHMDNKKPGKRHTAHLSLYPDKLLPFLPVDGPDNQYGQIHPPIKKDPYKSAGIKGFETRQPYAASSYPVIPSTSKDIKFPSLAKLNANCFEWDEGEEDMVTSDHSLCADIEVFTAAPTPLPPAQAPPTPLVPEVGPLTASILASVDKLFFVSHCVPGSDTTEWALVRVDFQRYVQAHPSALKDGRFIVDFYTCHPADKRYNAINQRYWLEYHPKLEVANPYRDRCTHIIRPSAQLPSYAIAEGLQPFSQWMRLTNADTFIVGPFDFAIINGRKSKDRVPFAQWKIL